MSFPEVIEAQILQNRAFAFIRLPGESKIYLLTEDNTGQNIYSFTSFDTSKKYIFHFSEFQELTISELKKEFSVPLSVRENTNVISKDGYQKLLDKTIRFLEEEKARKIVISREKWIARSEIHPIQSFLFLCKKHPNSFCHLSYWNTAEVWLGATPEVLGTFENSVFKTMSLAGTLPDGDSFLWEEKEIKEHRYVTEYIHEKLKNYSSLISLNGPNTLHLGHIKHLITYFSAKLESSTEPATLIQALHPTPAVCGLPLEISRDFILREEGYNRDFYAGYIGLQTPDSENYFVNLRCGKLYRNGALLFVGGGITAQSNSEKEWKETELKAGSITESLCLE
ncbi:MAG: isochorismate synthase [Flavobacteriaceae bacterium]|jgi:isochorismate synthase|nr:isochorismate synthase [Flavobacteriaceae bacterium]